MLDFNHRPDLSERLCELIDAALQQEHRAQSKRSYLGASRLGVSCDRALQYEFMHVPEDEGRTFQGKTLRIFSVGHVFEDLAVTWIRKAGFELHTHPSAGEQYGFTAAGGRDQCRCSEENFFHEFSLGLNSHAQTGESGKGTSGVCIQCPRLCKKCRRRDLIGPLNGAALPQFYHGPVAVPRAKGVEPRD